MRQTTSKKAHSNGAVVVEYQDIFRVVQVTNDDLCRRQEGDKVSGKMIKNKNKKRRVAIDYSTLPSSEHVAT